jgi:phage-related protein
VANVGHATLTIIPSAKGFSRALSGEIDGDLDRSGRDGGKRFGGGMMAGLAGGLAGLGATVAAAVGVDFFKGAIEEASGLGESLNALNVVYGANAAGIADLGKKAADSLGLSNLEFNNLAVRFSSFADTIAGPGGNVVGTLEDLTGRAADFASVMNLDVAQAAELFQSGLAGETEPLRAFGIDLSAAAVETYALANGIASSAGSMTEAQKVQARYGLLMQSTSKTAGDFANTSGSLANQQRILGARWDNLTATIGQALLPAVTGLVSGLNGLLPVLGSVGGGIGAIYDLVVKGDFTGRFREIFGVEEDAPIVGQILAVRDAVVGFFASLTSGQGSVGGISAVLGSLGALVTGTLLPAFSSIASTFVGTVLPIAMQLWGFFQATAIPVFHSVVGIITGTVIPAVASLATWFANDLYPKIAAIVAEVSARLQPVLTAVSGFITGTVIPVVQQIAAKFREWLPTIQAVIGAVVTIIGWVVKFASTILGTVIPPILSFAGFLIRNVVSAITTVIGWVVNIIGAIVDFGGAIGDAIGAVGRFASSVGEAVGSALDWFRDLPGMVLGAVGSLGSTLFSAGADLIQGLINGVASMAGRIASAAMDVVRDAVEGVKDFLGINSPSRLFMEIGGYVGEGMALGVASQTDAVHAAVNGLAPTTAPAFPAPAIAAPAGTYGAVSAPGTARGGLVINGDVYTHDLDEFVRRVETKQQDAAVLFELTGVL